MDTVHHLIFFSFRVCVTCKQPDLELKPKPKSQDWYTADFNTQHIAVKQFCISIVKKSSKL